MKKNKFLKYLAAWLDVVFLLPGMVFVSLGVFLIYVPAGYIILGLCFTALAFLIAHKQATGGDSW